MCGIVLKLRNWNFKKKFLVIGVNGWLSTDCASSNWVLCVTTFRLVILAWNRPHSLARLLDSVTATHWDWPASPDWDIVIDFQVDGGGGERGEEVRRLVENFTFPVGRKVVRANSENR